MPFEKKNSFGAPLPDRDHAVSVVMDTWEKVKLYEEGDAATHAQMQCGYPRFFLHPLYKELCKSYDGAGTPEEMLWVFPSAAVAEKCVRYAGAGRVVRTDEGVGLALLPLEVSWKGKEFWQHTGLIVSSRHAESLLKGEGQTSGTLVRRDVKNILARLHGVDANDVYLYPTGMGAIFGAYEAVTEKRGTDAAQLGFPYTDTLKILEKFGAGANYLCYNSPDDLEAVRKLASENKISAVFCEVPGNPLLRTIDLERLRAILKPYRIPLIIDDTLGMPQNIDISRYADITVTSLTKFFSGVGNVMGGSLLLNPKSPHYGYLKEHLDKHHEELLHPHDAMVLLSNAQGFSRRVWQINENAVKLAALLRSHPAVDQVYFTQNDPAYEALRKEGGGYGGLMSFTLKDPSRAPAVYDALGIAKGPSLGTDFTLASPFTLLAHYNELPWANSCGVPSELIRVSVGKESARDFVNVLADFERALDRANVAPVLKRTTAPAAPIR